MHRATPANAVFRAFSAGGARATISSIDPSKLMQEIGGGFMKGESRDKVEAPGQYGFTSVPHDADKGEDGKPGVGPEAFIQFMGGNRSFPVCGPIDDRRHRLTHLEKGDVALFRGKDEGQQFHMNGIGTFLSSFANKKLRFQLVEKAAQAASGASAQTFAEGGGGGGGGAQSGASQHGQRAVYKNKSVAHFEIHSDGTESVNKKHTIATPDGTAVHLENGHVYLGGKPGDGHEYHQITTMLGQALNVFARQGPVIPGGPGGGVSDAPHNGNQYVRQDGGWHEITRIDGGQF